MTKRGIGLMTDKISIRPVIDGISRSENKSEQEQFQNSILRPIIKLQHPLLVEYFKEYLLVKKCKFADLSESKRVAFIKAAFLRDNSFKAELKGLIIGQFTVEEFSLYNKYKSDFNKRILTMIEQRILSVINLF